VGIRIDPALLGRSRSSSGLDPVASLNAIESQRARFAGAQNQNWDPVWRPIEHLFNALTALNSGAKNAALRGREAVLDTGVRGDQAINEIPVAKLPGAVAASVGGTVGGFVDGFFASFNNDSESPNYMTGAKYLEARKDLDNRDNPNYVDTKNNWGTDQQLAATGFLLDVVGDPLTYAPGGVFLAAGRGAVRGAQAAGRAAKAARAGEEVTGPTSRVLGAMRGVVHGGDETYKLGKFSKSVYPVGLKSWKQRRDYEAFTRIKNNAGLNEEQMLALTAGKTGYKRFTEEILPGLRKLYGDDYLSDVSPATLKRIAGQGGRYSILTPDATKLREGYINFASGGEAARVVGSGVAPAGLNRSVTGLPVKSKRSTRARVEAMEKRLADEAELSESEILRFDVEKRAAVLRAEIKDLQTQRIERTAVLKAAMSEAPAGPAAQTGREIISEEMDLARQAEAQQGLELDNRLAELETELATTVAKGEQYRLRATEIAAELGRGRGTTEQLANEIEEVTNYLAETGVKHGGIIGMTGPEHAALRAIDDDLSLTPGATQVLLGAIHGALENQDIANTLIGKLETGESFGIKELIGHFYGTKKIPDLNLSKPEVEFLVSVVDSILYKMWDITRVATSFLDDMASEKAVRAVGTMDELVGNAVSEQAALMIKESSEHLTYYDNKLYRMTPEYIDENPGEVEQLRGLIADIEASIRFLERGGSPTNIHLAPFLLMGGAEAAARAARAAGIDIRHGAGYAEVIKENTSDVLKAVERFDATDAPLEAKTNAVRDSLGQLIDAHSGAGALMDEAAALLGVSRSQAVAKLIDVATGSFRPLKDAIFDETTYAKLIIILAKLPMDLPGISNVARERAFGLSEMTELGVYGLERNFDEEALKRYGRDMLRLFETGGGYAPEIKPTGGMDSIGDSAGLDAISDAQRFADDMGDGLDDAGNDILDGGDGELVGAQTPDMLSSEVAGGRLDRMGFGMGGEIDGLDTQGGFAAFDIFGNIVARGKTEDELLDNFELYRGAQIREVAEATATSMNAAISGRHPSYSGVVYDDFMDYWESELASVLAGNRTANIFNRGADTTLRGKGVDPEVRRVLANTPAELGDTEMRIWGETLLFPGKETSILSFTHEAPFKLGRSEYRTGAHAFVSEQLPPESPMRAEVAALQTAEEVMGYFKGVRESDLDPKFVGDGRWREYARLAGLIVSSRAKLPGFDEAIDLTGFSNIVESIDRMLGAALKPLGYTTRTVGQMSGANIVGKALMRYRAKRGGYADTVAGKSFFRAGQQGSGLPVVPDGPEGYARIDEEFRALTGREPAIPISDHVLGYAREPLAIEDWIRTIQVVASSDAVVAGGKRGGKFFDQYRLVAERLKIPILKEQVKPGGLKPGQIAPPLAAEILASPAVIAAHRNYVYEFERYVKLDKESGVLLREAEAKGKMGQSLPFTKGQMGLARGEAGRLYGVDPLGRTFRSGKIRPEDELTAESANAFDGPRYQIDGVGESVSIYAPLAAILRDRDDIYQLNKIIERNVNFDGEDAGFESAIEDAFGLPMADQIIPMIRAIHGEHRKWGLTPTSAKAINEIRSAIIGNGGAARLILEDLAPRLQVAKLTVKEVKKLIEQAEGIQTDVKAGSRAALAEEVINGEMMLELTNPASYIGAMILHVARKIDTSVDYRATTGILDRPWERFIGNKGLVDDGFDDPEDLARLFENPMSFNRLNEVSLMELSNLTGIDVEDLFAISEKARGFLTVDETGKEILKGSFDEYRAQMTTIISDILRAPVFQAEEELSRDALLAALRSPAIRLEAERSIVAAKSRNNWKKVKTVKAPQGKLSDEMLQSMNNKLKSKNQRWVRLSPREIVLQELVDVNAGWVKSAGYNFSKFLERVNAVLMGEQIGGVNSNQFDIGVGRAAARARMIFNINESGQGNLIVGQINKQNVEKFLDESEMQIVRDTASVSDTLVLGGDRLAVELSSLTPEQLAGIRTQWPELAKQETTRAIDAVRKSTNAAYIQVARTIDSRLRPLIRKSIADTVQKLWKEKKYAAIGPDVDRVITYAVMRDLEAVGRRANLARQEVADLKVLALKIADEVYAEVGAHRVAGLTKNNVGKYKFSLDNRVDWAYLSFSDVITSLRNSGDTRVYRMLVDEIDKGITIPSNVIAEMGALAIKLSEARRAGAKITPADASAIIYHALVASIKEIPDKLFTRPGAVYDRVLSGTDGAFPTTEVGAQTLSEIALALSDPKFAENLFGRHMINAGRALSQGVSVGERDLAAPVLQKILDAKMQFGGTLDGFIAELINATPALRKSIADSRISPDSSVAYIARVGLQRGIGQVASAADVNVSRVTRRMDAAAEEAAGKPQAQWRSTMSKERARLALQRQALANKLANENTVIRISQLAAAGDPASIQAAFDHGINMLESSMQTSLHLAGVFNGGTKYAEILAAQRQLALELDDATRVADGTVRREEELNKMISKTLLAKKNAKINARQSAQKRIRERIKQGEAELQKLAMDPKRRRRAAMLQSRLKNYEQKLDAEVRQIKAEISALYGTDVVNALAKELPADLARVSLSSYKDDSAVNTVHRAVSGEAGMQEMASIRAGIESSIDNNYNNYEKLVERTFLDGYLAFNGDNEAFVIWSNGIFNRLFGYDLSDPKPFATLEEVLSEITDKGLRKFVTDMHHYASYVVGKESKLVRRAGLDGKWINDHIPGGPLGVTAAARFDDSGTGSLTARQVSANVFNMITAETGTGGGGADWMTILKGYGWSFHQASLVPTLGAEFSARFGHTALGYDSVKDAIADGLVAIRKEGTLAQWLDSDELYPPDFLRRMANMERLLDTTNRPTFAGSKNAEQFQKMLGRIDKATGAIKASLTIWRAGHHVVSAMGEALMNTLDGVFNPYRYAQAVKVMGSVGEFRAGNVFGHNYEIPLNEFSESYKFDDVADGVPGIKITVAGNQKVISFAEVYRMLNDKGLLLNNNTAEDLFVEGFRALPGRNQASGLLGKIMRVNEGLGAFSARRDNFFRVAHAIDIMQRKSHKSLGSLVDELTETIQSFHPTMQKLSPSERIYARRLFFFYTWQKMAATAIVKSMFERPDMFTIPAKVIYNMSIAMGGDPQSIGQPMPNDPRLAGFAAANVLGPSWYNEEDGSIWGFSLNAPQMDIFSNLVGSLYYDPSYSAGENIMRGASEFIGANTAGQYSPALNYISAITTQSEYRLGEWRKIEDAGQYLVDSTGLGTYSRATGIGLINNNGILAPRTDDRTPEKQFLSGVNSIVGLKFTEWSEWYERAGRERTERYNRELEELQKRLLMP
jgi:hypothetical protein